MPQIIDAVGPFTGQFIYSIGSGFFGANPYAANELDVARQRPLGSTWASDFGAGQATNLRKFAPSIVTSGRVMLAMNERPDPGQTASQTWALAAVDGSSQLQTNMMTLITALTAPISGYPSAPQFTTVWLRIAREMGSAGNELPIINDTDAANAVTFYRREIPRWRAAATAAGCTIKIHWNLCGGTDTTYQNATLAYPGSDMCDGLGPDVYDTNNSGIYPFSFAPYYAQSNLSADTAIGITSLVRVSNQVGPQAGDTVEIGTGTANVERVVVSSVSGTTINFSAALTKTHQGQTKDGSGNVTFVGDTLTKVYAVGAKVTQYGMTYISLVSSNVTPPDPDPWSSNAAWGIYPFNRKNHGGGDIPGTNCMSAAERLIAIDAWTRAFRLKWYGEGGTPKWFVQKWYNFARGITTVDMTFDSRIPSPVGQNVAFIMPEVGCEGLPSTNYKGSFGGGDNFIFVGNFFSWCATMKVNDGRGVDGHFWYNHDNGSAGAHTQAFTMLPPWGVTTGAPHGPYFVDAGQAYIECSRPSAQIRIQRGRGGVVRLAGSPSPFIPVAPTGGGSTAGFVTATVGPTV